MKYLKSLLVTLIILVSFTSCSKDEVDAEVTTIDVKLKSTTGELKNVFLDIIDIQFKVGVDETWMSLDAINLGTNKVCNLDEDSAWLLVDHMAIESTYIHEIRIILGNNNFIDINGVLTALDVSSLGNATPSNLIKTELVSNRTYEFLIDVDIDNSISFNTEENMMVLNPKIYTAIRQFEY